MAVSQTNAYKLQKRQYYKTTTREGMFVYDFVKTKYPAIYHEAATMYNLINQSYSNKPNLRKTLEYRLWKNEIAKANNQPITPIPRQRNQVHGHMQYPSISIETTTTENIEPILQPNIPGETTTTENIEPILQPNIPGETTTTENVDPILQLNIPGETTTTTENTVPQGSTPQKENQAIHKLLTGNQMQLTIPLIRFPPLAETIQSSASPTAVVEEDDQGILTAAAQEITMQEGDQPEVIDPSLFDQISPEMMDRLISELQSDPNLKSIMDDVQNSMEREANIEEELIGLTIDLPELEDPLEEESVFW